MAADALRLQVLFSAIDRLTGPLKGMTAGSNKAKAAIAATRKEIQSLERAQGRAGAYRKAESNYRELGDALKVARLEAKAAKLELEAAEKPSAKLARAAEKAAAAEAKAGRAYHDAGDKLQKLGSELEATGVDMTRLIDHEDRLALKVYEANKRLKEQTGVLERNAAVAARSDKIKSFGRKTAAVGAGATAAVTLPAVAFGKQAFDAASDAAELQSAFDVTFGRMSAAMNKWAEQTGNAMGRSTQEMQKGANTFGIFFNQVAAPEKAADMSKEFATLAQDLGSFFNTDTQTAIDKLRSGLSGEAEPLRDFGVFLNEAAVKAKLLEMKVKPVGKEFTDQQKIMARYALILDATKNAQGDAIRTAGSAANQVKAQAAAFEEAKVAAGEKLMPALVPLIKSVTDLINRFNNLSPATQATIVKAIALAAVFGPILTAVGGLIVTFGVAFPAMMKLARLFAFVKDGALVAGPALRALGIAFRFMLGPWGLLLTAIGVGAFLIYKHWDGIKAAFGAAGSWILAKFEQLKGLFLRFPFIFGPLGIAVAFVIRHWTQIKGVFGAGLAFLLGLPGRFAIIGSQIIQGLISGVVGKLAALKSTIVNAASSAASWFKQKLGIKSPSRVFLAFGGHITDGLSRGIASGTASTVREVDRLSSRVAGAFAAGSLAVTPVPALASQGGVALSGQTSETGRATRSTPPMHVEIHIHQLPGEDAGALARRVADELRSIHDAASRSSFADD